MHEPSCVPRVAKPFFIPMVHNPLGAVGHMVAPELSPQEGRARSYGTHGSVVAHLGREVRSRALGHMAAPEPTLAGGRGPGLRDTW
jgi:hypothetical protein